MLIVLTRTRFDRLLIICLLLPLPALRPTCTGTGTWRVNAKLSSSDMPDPTTQSNYLQIYTTNVDFNWSLDFSNQILEGTATHTVLAREAGIEEVM